MKFNWRIEAAQWALIGGMFLLAAVVWNQVPERMPIHWNIRGEADGYGNRFVGLLAMPFTALGIYALLIVLPWFDPRRENYRSFASAYNWIRLMIVAFLTMINLAIVLIALGYQIDITAVITMAMGLLFIVLGLFMKDLRQNWFVGVRTPWTLSSQLSWDKTHQLASWILPLLGVIVFILGLVRTPWMLAVTIAAVAVGMGWLVVYSYLVYRRDPARRLSGGTAVGN